MTSYETENEDLSGIWLDLFEILSLESTYRFLADMDYELAVTASVQTSSRYYVCNYLNPAHDHLELWHETMRQIEQANGLSLAESIIKWSENVYCKSKLDSSYRAWNGIFLNVLCKPKNAYLLEKLDFSDEEFSLMRAIAHNYRHNYMKLRQKLKNAQSEIEANAQDTWKGCYDYLDYVTDGGFYFISSQSTFVLQKRLLKRLQSSFSQDALNLFQQWGQNFSIEVGMINADAHLYLSDD